MFKSPTFNLVFLLKNFRDNYFNNSASTPLAEILNNRSYCFKVNKEVSTSTFISISNTKKETLSYKKIINLSVDDLRLLFKELINSSHNILTKELLFDISKSRYKDITLERFAKVEDKSLTTPFKCFRDLDLNSINNNNFLSEEIFNNSSLRNRFFIVNNSNFELNKRAVKEYLKTLLEFKKYCLLLIYLTSGLPLRGTELVTLKYLNSYKDKREIFLDISSNLFIINISYYKGQVLSDKRASNIRYLPLSVSQIFLLYIVLVDPFISFLNINLLSSKKLIKNKSLIPYFFFVNNRLLDSKDLSLKLNSFSKLIIGQKLGIQVYRQIIIGIIKEFMLEKLNPKTLLLEEEEDKLKELIAAQSNHSSSIEDLNYGRTNSTFNNINSNLQFKYLQFCLRYFAYFNINSIDILVESYKNLLKIKNKLIIEESLNVSNSLALRYNRSINLKELESSNTLNKKHNRQISSISSDIKVIKRVKTSDLIQLSSLDLNSNTLSSLLKEFLQDNNASFKSLEQELLIKSILLKIPYILAVLPTSIGKSLAYLLTSSLSISKVTIVILPLVGLKQDILRRSKEFNIPSIIFEDTKQFQNLTLVSIETIIEGTFISLVQSLINNNNLDRIIIDECHLLISASNYRSIMFRFKELLLLSTQFVFLTGTLPFSFEEELINILYLQDLSIIRANCTKSNIAYKASTYKSIEEEDRIQELKEYIKDFQIKEFLTNKDKVLIFCPTINNINLVADTLNCSRYSSDLSIKEKEETLKNFYTSDKDYFKILVCSSGLEEGFDYPYIRLVIYKDLAYSFLGFLQGSSRAGRDNQPCTSMFFYNNKDYRLFNISSIITNNLLKEDKGLIINYLNESICRRRVISLYLDNKVVDQCSTIDNLCDLCASRTSIINKQVLRIQESNKKAEEECLKQRKQLLWIFSKCTYCIFLRGEIINKEVDHSSSKCSLYLSLESLAKGIKSLIKEREVVLKEDSCCFNCLLPTIICKHLQESNYCLNNRFMF